MKNYGDVFIAGSLGAFGTLADGASREIMIGADGALSYGARAIGALAGGTAGGVAQTAAGQVEHQNDEQTNNSVNQDYKNFEESLAH